MIAPLAPNETLRLQALHRLKILDTEYESAFDRITDLASYIYKTEVATVSLLDMNRQWFKACIGWNVRETPRDYSICAHAVLQSDVLIIGDAREDERFSDNPLVSGPPHIRFYAGAPIIDREGYALGTVCVIDYQPRAAEDVDPKPLRCLAELALRLMDRHRTPSA